MPLIIVSLANRIRLRHIGVSVLALLLVVTILVGLRSPSASSQVQFADPAFRTTWERTDGPVASGSVLRGWIWGPVPNRALTEAFAGLPGNAHLVQYFDKGRMEINDPNGNKSDPFYVTNGLLAVELISGQQQTGVSTFTSRGPSTLNLASDSDDPSAPTYQSFNGVSSIPNAPNERKAAPATDELVRQAIDRQGNTQPWPEDHSDYEVTNVYYENATGHNIPNVFWEYLNSQGPIVQDGQAVSGPLFSPTFAITGYPISEPYWAYVKVERTYRDVLIQAYERRVLTFVPSFPEGYNVQMGNIGQHYYDWRYNSGPTGGGGSGPATPTAVPVIPLASVRIDGISYPKSVVDINGSYVILTNFGETPVLLDGWRIDAPNWNYINTYYFPRGVTIAGGDSLRVRSGIGESTSTDLYMFRSTPMWVDHPSNLAVLYDNYGRTVSRFFPAGDEPPVPTAPPVATATPPGPRPATATPGGTSDITPTPNATPPVKGETPTRVVPTPVPTSSPMAIP